MIAPQALPTLHWSVLSLSITLSLSLSGVDDKEKALLDEEGGGGPRTD